MLPRMEGERIGEAGNPGPPKGPWRPAENFMNSVPRNGRRDSQPPAENSSRWRQERRKPGSSGEAWHAPQGGPPHQKGQEHAQSSTWQGGWGCPGPTIRNAPAPLHMHANGGSDLDDGSRLMLCQSHFGIPSQPHKGPLPPWQPGPALEPFVPYSPGHLPYPVMSVVPPAFQGSIPSGQPLGMATRWPGTLPLASWLAQLQPRFVHIPSRTTFAKAPVRWAPDFTSHFWGDYHPSTVSPAPIAVDQVAWMLTQ